MYWHRPVSGLLLLTAGLCAAASRETERIPLRFELNTGQAGSSVSFLSRTSRGVFLLEREGSTSWLTSTGNQSTPSSLRMRLLGSNQHAQWQPERATQGSIHYLKGSAPAQWNRDIRTFEQVRRPHVYPGIDLVYYGSNGALEYDFVVAPKADPGQIRIAVDGTAARDTDGSLILTSGEATLRWKPPYAYQERRGIRQQVAASFVVQGNQIGFSLGEYDRSVPLVIDPVLAFASFFGGSADDEANAVAVDKLGNIYLAGYTYSTDFQVTSESKHVPNRYYDIFVTKLAKGARDVMYSVVLGGAGNDTARSIAVDGEGNVYLTGETSSGDFPTIRPFLAKSAGGTSDAYVLKLDPYGRNIVYSSYLGGTKVDEGRAIAVDKQGNAFVAGATESSTFVIMRAMQPVFAGSQSGFITKVAADGSLLWSTYLGGRSATGINAIAVDDAGSAYVAGSTTSSDFPVTSSAIMKQKPGQQSGFVAKIDSEGKRALYATYFGGDRITGINTSAITIIRGIAVDAAGNAYVTGDTTGSDLPLVPSTPLQKKAAGDPNRPSCFITKFDPNGTSLLYSTYLGGTAQDRAYSIAVDANGSAVVAGETSSLDFNLKNAFQTERMDKGKTDYDGFVARIDPSGASLVWSTLIGGQADERVVGVAIDPQGRTVIAGVTSSSLFPRTSNALQRGLFVIGKAVARDPFVSVIEEGPRSCSYTVLDTSAGLEQMGGTGTFRVIPSDGSCKWTASTPASWIQLTGTTSGTGIGTVAYKVEFNPGAPREGLIQVGDAVFTVSQAQAPCWYFVYPGRLQASSTGGILTASMAALGEQCVWSVTPGAGWVNVETAGIGTDRATLSLTVDPNESAESRSTTLYIGGQMISITQSGTSELSISSVVDTASLLPSIASGSFLNLSGRNLASSGGNWQATTVNGQFPLSLNNLRVRVEDSDAWVQSITDTGDGATVLAPRKPLKGRVAVQVMTASESFTAFVNGSEVAPALFSYVVEGTRYAAATLGGQNVPVAKPGSITTIETRGARAGDIIQLQASGLGPITGTPPEGEMLTAAYPVAALDTIRVRIGATVIPVQYAGLVQPGLYQINFQVPPDLGTGDLPIIVQVGTTQSPEGIYLYFE